MASDFRQSLGSPPQPFSESRMELVEFSSFNNNTQGIQIANEVSTASWHPKLTLYRVFVLVTTVGLGAAKLVTSYLSLNEASITLEWVFGVVVFLIFFLLESYDEDTRQMRWLFHVDYVQYIWNLLAIFDIDRPSYRSDELNHTSMDLRPHHPPITGYRILVTTLVLFFGMLKSVLGYGNQTHEVTTVESVFGVGIVTCLYWLGLYESSSTKIYPFLFHEDYSTQISPGPVAHSIAEIALYLIALTICGGFTAVLFFLSSLFLNLQWSASMFPQFPIAGYATSTMIADLMLTLFLSAAGCSLALIYLPLRMFCRSLVGRYVLGMAGPRHVSSFVRSVYQDYWLPPRAREHRPPQFYLKRVLIRQLIRLPLRLFLLHLLFLSLLMLLWLSLGIAAVVATFLDSFIPVTFTFPLFTFIFFLLIVWGCGWVLAQEFRQGFRGFLAEIHHDYTDEGPSTPLPTTASH